MPYIWFVTGYFATMILKKLTIFNYKNIREAQLDFSPKINCFVGNNGMGKTNIIDAIHYLSFCRSITTPTDSYLINHDSDFFMLEGEYDNEGKEERIFCGMKRGTRKHIKRNKKEYKRLSEHLGLIPAILISPSDTALADGSSENRRRMMDFVISQYNPAYIDALTRYNNALQQRNVLLKSEEITDLSLMELWEEEMAREGEKVYGMRRDFIEHLQPAFQDIYLRVSKEHELPEMKYISHCQRGSLLDVIRRDRHKDLAIGYSLHGVHRDDIEMTIDGFPLRREGSQGQLKTFVIAMKLAQFSLLCHTASSTTPLLLLDDIFDKLDRERVEQIIDLVSGDSFGQIFITDTNLANIDTILRKSKHEYRLFTIREGVIQDNQK